MLAKKLLRKCGQPTNIHQKNSTKKNYIRSIKNHFKNEENNRFACAYFKLITSPCR